MSESLICIYTQVDGCVYQLEIAGGNFPACYERCDLVNVETKGCYIKGHERNVCSLLRGHWRKLNYE